MIATSALRPVAVLAVLCCCAASASDVAWRDAAHEALLDALQDAYPDAGNWHVRPLLGKDRGVDLQVPSKVSVVHLGSRSAVRVSWTHAKRSGATVWFAVEATQPMLVSTSAVRAGEPLSPQLAMQGAGDPLVVGCTPVASADSLNGMRARVTLRQGQPICAEAMEARPPVARGDAVTVKSTAGSVTVLARGIAQQDAALGQVLRIRNPSSGDTYRAAVSGAGEVVVHE